MSHVKMISNGSTAPNRRGRVVTTHVGSTPAAASHGSSVTGLDVHVTGNHDGSEPYCLRCREDYDREIDEDDLTCAECEEHFDSQEELDAHVRSNGKWVK